MKTLLFYFTADEEHIERQASQRSSTKSSDLSSVHGTNSPLVDSLLKSLAKDQQPPEPRNQTATVTCPKEVDSAKANLTLEGSSNQQLITLPNNQVGGTSTLPPRTPIPPESLKCNILKAKVLEQQGKNSNLVSISTADNSTTNDKNNSDAATIVSVVSFAAFFFDHIHLVYVLIKYQFFFLILVHKRGQTYYLLLLLLFL